MDDVLEKKEVTEQTCIEDLSWQLTFENIDWGHFIDTAKRARNLQRAARLNSFPPYLFIGASGYSAVVRENIDENGYGVYQRHCGAWHAKVKYNSDGTLTAYIMGPQPDKPLPVFPCTEEQYKESDSR